GMTEFYKMTRNCLKCEKSASKGSTGVIRRKHGDLNWRGNK
ncbi:hypothetical protein ATR1_126c0001, partial [Acetobacter tropicalis]